MKNGQISKMDTLTPEQVRIYALISGQVRIYEWKMEIGRGNKLEHAASPRKIEVPVNLRATLDPPRSLLPNYSYECPETPE